MNTSTTEDATDSPPLETGVVDLCGGYKLATGNRSKKRKNRPPTASSGTADAIVVDPFARRVKESSAASYKRVLGPLRMEFVESFSTPHSFMKTSAPATKTNLARLMHELVEYQLNLPIMETGSIFVRALESRCDLLRCLITGPSGTPYEQGCFLFDVHLHDYPHQAPRVQFLTTGGGKVRFNPNLYNCGKVCLSLLGTWQGPGWISNKSTLLQVLVSIQGLILVEDPYYNEPSYEQTRGTASGKNKSAAYNVNIRKFTLNHAFPLEQSSRQHYSEFDAVVEAHYYQRAPQVLQQLNQWDTTDPSLKARTAVLRPFFDNFMKQREADSAPKPPEVVDLLGGTPSPTMKKQQGTTSGEIIDLLD